MGKIRCTMKVKLIVAKFLVHPVYFVITFGSEGRLAFEKGKQISIAYP